MKKLWFLLPVATAYATTYAGSVLLPPAPLDNWWAVPTAVLLSVIFLWSVVISFDRAN